MRPTITVLVKTKIQRVKIIVIKICEVAVSRQIAGALKATHRQVNSISKCQHRLTGTFPRQAPSEILTKDFMVIATTASSSHRVARNKAHSYQHQAHLYTL